jgi:hypothetical protein
MKENQHAKRSGGVGHSSRFRVRAEGIPAELERIWLIEEARSDLALATLAVGNRHIFGMLGQYIVALFKLLRLRRLLRSLDLDGNPQRVPIDEKATEARSLPGEQEQ